ncbi:RND superfamily putative drug exporter [Micromonospora pisi]|uniref:RND superfamily putative drug exporter n=1 Tax=Micromonospora pisi TaxID=589240 RepID=A0A495JBD8_9ACTN|nr:MMPL family transporter [Micromonospora pisi]RKR86310.1 RND superfamily putative drug exporter [Micromonospora pisi]
MFAAVGRLVVRHPVWVILAWVAAAVGVIGFAPTLTATTDEASFLPSHYESIRAAQLQQQAFPRAATPAAIIVFERQDNGPLTEADAAKVTSIAQALAGRHIPDVINLTPTPPSPNRLIQIIAVEMTPQRGPGDQAQPDAVKALRAALPDQLAGSGLKSGITGTAAQNLDAQKSGDRANAIIGITTIGLILILLLIIFRSPIIAILPVIAIGLVSQIATGLIAWANQAFDLKTDSSVSAMLIVVLFGVGTDYILFLMFRFRERLRLGEDPKTAMVSAVARAGEAIASAAGAVIIAFLALTLSTLGLFRSLGPALAIAVATTLVAGLTLIPAIVSLLGTKVFWPSKAWRHEPRGARFAAIGRSLGRRPALYAGVSGVALVILAVFSFGFHPNFDLSSGSTATESESNVWSKELLKGLPAGATEPSMVFLRSDAGQPLPADQLTAYRAALAKVPGVGQVGEPALSPDKTVADFQVTLANTPQSAAALRTVKGPLRDTAHSAAPDGTTALVGGITAVFVDIQAAVNRDYAVVFPVAAVLIMIILGLLLRSVVAPWYLILSVGLGFAATLGATVLIFQDALGEPGLIFILPVIMYLFVVALGTDYNILMVARLREEAREGRDPRDAAAMAIRHAGPTIAAAGLILAGTFASLMLAGNSTLTQMGFAISAGIAIVAFVMSLFLTPAITALLGHTAWWPGHADVDREAPRPGAHRLDRP